MCPGKRRRGSGTAPIQIALRKVHLFQPFDAAAAAHRIDHPHHDAADDQGPAHHDEAFEILTDLLLQEERRNRGHDERDQRQAERMR